MQNRALFIISPLTSEKNILFIVAMAIPLQQNLILLKVLRLKRKRQILMKTKKTGIITAIIIMMNTMGIIMITTIIVIVKTHVPLHISVVREVLVRIFSLPTSA